MSVRVGLSVSSGSPCGIACGCSYGGGYECWCMSFGAWASVAVIVGVRVDMSMSGGGCGRKPECILVWV